MHTLVGDVEVMRIFESENTLHLPEWLPAYDRAALLDVVDRLPAGSVSMDSDTVVIDNGSWLLRRGGTVILIDTCVGNHKDRLGADGLHNLNTTYLDRLAAAGVAPDDVDYVMCTHLHVDHVGWNTRLLDGRWVPTFPNARYVVGARELDAARQELQSPGPLQQFLQNVYADSILPIEEAGLTQLIHHEDELPLGLKVQLTPGHSAGHIRFDLHSQGDLAIFAGDIIHAPLQAPLWQWSTCYCHDLAQAADTRRTLLETCEASNALLLTAHFRSPHAARVRSEGGRFFIKMDG